MLFVAGACEALSRAGGAVARNRLAIATGLVVLPMEFQAVVRTFALEPSGRFQRLVDDLRQNRRPGEPVYIFARSLPAWIYYSTDWTRPDTARTRYLVDAAGAGGFAFENRESRGKVGAAERPPRARRRRRPVSCSACPRGWSGGRSKSTGGRSRTAGGSRRSVAESRGQPIRGSGFLATTYYAPESELFKRCERDARRRTYARLEPGSALVRYEFAPAGADSSAVQKESRSFGRRSTSTVAGR